MSIDKLVRQCKKRDGKAQEQLYRLFSRQLFGICLKYSRNKVEAEDNLQDSFITIFNKIESYDFKGSFEGWLRKITMNTVLQKYRKEGVFTIISDNMEDEVSVEVSNDEDISIDSVLELIQELPDRYRLVFNLYALDDYSHKEIATLLNISEGTSKSNLARARMILKDRIEKTGLKKNMKSL
jgi:RNA polymerase sigma factor (sigma-70 family)